MATPQQHDGRRRFEGRSLDDVLQQVHAELGTDAQIVEANKIRSGGLGGFFSREVFEVYAEPATADAALDEEGRDLLEMLSAGLTGQADAVPAAATVAATEAAAATGSTAQPDREPMAQPDRGPMAQPDREPMAQPAPGPTPALGSRITPATPDGRPLDPSMAIAQRIAAATAGRPDPVALAREAAQQGFEPMRAPDLGTSGGAFTEVLHRIAADAGADVAAAVDERLRPPAAPTPAPEPAPTPSSPAVPDAATGLRPVGPQARTRARQAAEIAVTNSRREVVQGPVVQRRVEEDPVTRTDELPVPVADDADALVAAQRNVVRLDPDVHRRTRRLLTWLAHDELPRTTLVAALRGLPTAPPLPDTRGVVVAIVGERRHALKVAKHLARSCGGRAKDVVLASEGYRGTAFGDDALIRTADEARRDRQGWRRREAPTIVVVDSPAAPMHAAQGWTREVLTNLEPFQVIGIADATRKNEDLVAWAQAIGGVDAFAVHGTDATSTPYSVLALEVPISWIEGQPATPDRWADALMAPAA